MTFAAPTQACLSTCTGAHTIPCALPAGHGGPHRSSPSMSWHDPPLVFVGGVPHAPDDGDITFSWERVTASRERQPGRLAFAGRRPDTGCTPGGAS